MVGDDDGEVPPVPIPNTEVKLTRAEDSWLETACENRWMPTSLRTKRLIPQGMGRFCFLFYFDLAAAACRYLAAARSFLMGFFR